MNEQLQKGFDEMNKLAEEDNQPEYLISHDPQDRPLHFHCECADDKCAKRILVNHHEYNEIHKHRDRFVIVPGHEVESIERIIRREPGYNVVEKLSSPPDKANRLNPTTLDNT